MHQLGDSLRIVRGGYVGPEDLIRRDPIHDDEEDTERIHEGYRCGGEARCSRAKRIAANSTVLIAILR